MFATAFKPTLDILSYTPKWLPLPFTLEHFATAVHKPHFGDYVRNSLLVTISLAVMIVQMAPFEALLIPFFLMLRGLNLLNQLPSLILIYFIFTMPFTIWTLRGFVISIPPELEEAAMVDGASRFQAFMRVVFPLLAPGLVATSIFAFVTAWNEFLYAFVFMTDEAKFTLPDWLSSFRTAFGTDWGAIMAASSTFTIPVLVFFLLVQRRLVSGLTAGAVKG